MTTKAKAKKTRARRRNPTEGELRASTTSREHADKLALEARATWWAKRQDILSKNMAYTAATRAWKAARTADAKRWGKVGDAYAVAADAAEQIGNIDGAEVLRVMATMLAFETPEQPVLRDMFSFKETAESDALEAQKRLERTYVTAAGMVTRKRIPPTESTQEEWIRHRDLFVGRAQGRRLDEPIADRAAPKKKAARPKRKNAAQPSYKATHWGESGSFTKKTCTIVDTDHGELVLLGTLERVVYSTRKGGSDAGVLTDYDHAFEKTRPLLVYHACSRAKCASKGKLSVVDGSYRVTERGIVG